MRTLCMPAKHIHLNDDYEAYSLMSFLIADSVFRLQAYLLLWGSMYLYFDQLLHLLCWNLFVFRPLDLMHFARVDPWADKAIHSLVVFWSTALMCHSMSLHRLVHKECPWGGHSLCTKRWTPYLRNPKTEIASSPIVDSVFRLHAYLLLWGSMYLYFVH